MGAARKQAPDCRAGLKKTIDIIELILSGARRSHEAGSLSRHFPAEQGNSTEYCGTKAVQLDETSQIPVITSQIP